jgi:gluconate 2-dehydrogenase gamma chain
MPSTTNIDRRAAIQSLLQGGLALGLLPGFAETAWSAVAQAGGRPASRTLSAGRTDMITQIADIILPRTDTPGAIDVGVPPWIELVIAEYFSDKHRAAFLADLDVIDHLARAQSKVPLIAGSNGGFARMVASLDAATGSEDLSPAQRGYVKLKELILYGYFTSKPVQQDLLKVVIVPGRFDADVRIAPGSSA